MAMLLLARCCLGPGQVPRRPGLHGMAASVHPATASPVPINFWLLVAGDGPPPPADVSLCAACCEHHRARDVGKLTEALAALASRQASVEVDDGDARAFLLPGRKQVKVRESSFGVGGLGYSVWNAGIALSIWLAYQPERVRGQRVLELGSGVGLAGISAGLLGAAEVTLSDVANLDILEDNARLNGLEQTVQTVHLDWGVCCDDAFAPAAHGLRTYPLVIGSDVIYYEHSASALAAAVLKLTEPGGVAYLINVKNRRGSKTLFEILSASSDGWLEEEELRLFDNYDRADLLLMTFHKNP